MSTSQIYPYMFEPWPKMHGVDRSPTALSASTYWDPIAAGHLLISIRYPISDISDIWIITSDYLLHKYVLYMQTVDRNISKKETKQWSVWNLC